MSARHVFEAYITVDMNRPTIRHTPNFTTIASNSLYVFIAYLSKYLLDKNYRQNYCKHMKKAASFLTHCSDHMPNLTTRYQCQRNRETMTE